MKDILYYVIKHGDQYVAPYQSTEYLAWMKIDKILSTNRNLAVRFPTQEVAKFFLDWQNSVYSYHDDFDKSKFRVVRVVKTTYSH